MALNQQPPRLWSFSKDWKNQLKKFQSLEKPAMFFPTLGTFDRRMNTIQEQLTGSPEETQQIAADLARTLSPGAVLALHGDLGSGKTCFVQGLARGLGIDAPVTSPTFSLIGEYTGRLKLYHMDLYRLRSAGDAFDLGLEDYVYGDGICAIEWAERVPGLLPAHTCHIRFRPGPEENQRFILVEQP
jgi:tRNA threonylcarbamoyladenosine biosynthesis protein TsaE